MTREGSSVLDNNVLVGDNAVEGDVLARVGVLHEDGVADDRPLANLDAAEDDGVLHRSLNDTAVCNKGVFNDRTGLVASGCGVAVFGENKWDRTAAVDGIGDWSIYHRQCYARTLTE